MLSPDESIATFVSKTSDGQRRIVNPTRWNSLRSE
jgi:hypothetical protein